MKIRRPGYWTIHPTFSNNVRVEGNDVLTTGPNTDGCDPDSSWNVYIARNRFSTGDDCIAIKAGRDWSGLMVNISTQNVLAERNLFEKGHGVSIGSETSGWIRNVTIRDSVLHGTNLAVRIKTMRGRGGGVEDVLYQNLTGSVLAGVQLTLNYHPGIKPTNNTATPSMRRITLRDIDVDITKQEGAGVAGVGRNGHTARYAIAANADHGKEALALECAGLDDSMIEGLVFDHVSIRGSKNQACEYCRFQKVTKTFPKPTCGVGH